MQVEQQLSIALLQLDRLVDVIHTKQGDVYSLLVEEKIHTLPAVFGACMYGAYQEDGSLLPAVAVALRKGWKMSSFEFLKTCNSILLLEEQLVACRILNWRDFPIGVTGKTLKRVFREEGKQAARILAGEKPLNQLRFL